MSEPTSARNEPQGFGTFLILWVTQSVSVVGDLITYFAITLWLTKVAYPGDEDRAELAFALAAMMIGQAVVGLSCGAFIGVLVDRTERRRLMIIGNSANALLSATLAILAATDRLSIWALLPIVWVAAGVGELHLLALEASYVLLVPERSMPRANAMMGSTLAAADVIAPPLTIALMALATNAAAHGGLLGSAGRAAGGHVAEGIPFVFALDALTFVLSAVTILAIRIPTPPHVTEHLDERGIWSDAREGLRFLIEHRPLLALITITTVYTFAGAVAQVLLPLLVRFNLEADWSARGWDLERSLALITTAAGAAGIAGGVLVSLWGGLRGRLVVGAVAPMLTIALLQVALGLSGSILIATGLWALTALLVPVYRAHALTLWQSRTPPEIQGRVFALRRLLSAGSVPLGAALGGWLGGRFDPGHVIAAFGACAALFIAVQAWSPALRRIEARPAAAGANS